MTARAAPLRLQAKLGERLSRRRPEIERATLDRIYGVADPMEEGDAEYVAGLRATVSAVLGYAIAALEQAGSYKLPSPPPELAAQARYAARNGVSLDTVLRRYFAGYALLCDFIVEETEACGSVATPELQRVLRIEAALLDRLVIAVTSDYSREIEERQPSSSEQRRLERVKDLLAGELIDAAELEYELSGWHLGAIACGPGAREALHDLAAALDRKLLAVRPDGEKVWAWLGGRHKIGAREALACIPSDWPSPVILVLGEAAHGIDGWRLTHRQALAALPIAIRGPGSIIRFGDVALLASVLRDEALVTSFRDLYLSPLLQETDGEILCETLRAYFASERNVSSTAAALKITRPTVRSRLRRVEEKLGRALSGCAPELETALRLLDLGHRPGDRSN
jgi:PucR C-terminal helix-turn-helix domain/GGDEF-like domain